MVDLDVFSFKLMSAVAMVKNTELEMQEMIDVQYEDSPNEQQQQFV